MTLLFHVVVDVAAAASAAVEDDVNLAMKKSL